MIGLPRLMVNADSRVQAGQQLWKQDDEGLCLEGRAPRENKRSKSPHVSEPAKKRYRVPLKSLGLKQLIGR